jgi:hypothetical protein
MVSGWIWMIVMILLVMALSFIKTGKITGGEQNGGMRPPEAGFPTLRLERDVV